MPVGRFVLDVHGEPRTLWPASDALCAALQIINHLQDCAKDYRALNRVYIPMDAFAAAGIGPDALDSPRASDVLLRLMADIAKRTSELLVQSRPFAAGVRDSRLAFEVSVIQVLAEDLCRRLMRRDPLSERVHHRKSEILPLVFLAALRFAGTRLRRRPLGGVISHERR
jgi:hydroxysqualene synthase